MTDGHDPRSAREAAEALFKPQHPATAPKVVAADAGDVPSTDDPPPHAPRVLSVLQTEPPTALEQPVTKPPKKRRLSRASQAGAIPRSEYGRVRAMATYGMTTAQVANVYGVAESEIEGIVATKAGDRR